MVDVSGKADTVRVAGARALVELTAPVRAALLAGELPKGEALAVARIAGIQAAKETARLIPLCHPLALSSVDVAFAPVGEGDIEIRTEVRCVGPTGVEMEALCAASVAALTLYDMCKAVHRGGPHHRRRAPAQVRRSVRGLAPGDGGGVVSAPRVAIVGATGAVGAELLATLERRRFPVRDLRLLASPRSAGQTRRFAGEDLPVEALGPDSFVGIDLALFSAGGGTSREHAPRAVDAGAVVVDNSSAFRMDPEVPLVVPEVNAAAVSGHQRHPRQPELLDHHPGAGAGAAARGGAAATGDRLDLPGGLRGGGQRAMEEMFAMSRAALEGRSHQREVLPHSLAFNLYPQVDVFMDSAYTREEDKMLYETRKIMDLPDLPVEVTCVRVPVARCHSEAVSVELAEPLTPEAARAAFAAFPGVEVVDDPDSLAFPQPDAVTGRDAVAVGRVRDSRVFDRGLVFWVVGDQLLKGAALNAVQIAELL